MTRTSSSRRGPARTGSGSGRRNYACAAELHKAGVRFAFATHALPSEKGGKVRPEPAEGHRRRAAGRRGA